MIWSLLMKVHSKSFTRIGISMPFLVNSSFKVFSVEKKYHVLAQLMPVYRSRNLCCDGYVLKRKQFHRCYNISLNLQNDENNKRYALT